MKGKFVNFRGFFRVKWRIGELWIWYDFWMDKIVNEEFIIVV